MPTTEDRFVLEDETTSGDQYDGNQIVQEKFTDLQTIEEIFLTKMVINIHHYLPYQ